MTPSQCLQVKNISKGPIRVHGKMKGQKLPAITIAPGALQQFKSKEEFLAYKPQLDLFKHLLDFDPSLPKAEPVAPPAPEKPAKVAKAEKAEKAKQEEKVEEQKVPTPSDEPAPAQ